MVRDVSGKSTHTQDGYTIGAYDNDIQRSDWENGLRQGEIRNGVEKAEGR